MKHYPPAFYRLCAAALLFFLSFNLVIPELSSMLKDLNAHEYLGWIIPAFSFSALVARPLSGWLTDNIGRRSTMILGAVFCIVAGLFYPLIGSITAFLLVRAVHGFSTGFTPTGFTTYTADIIPESHRGRAMGWLGMFNNAGSSLGYGLGAIIALHFGRNQMFWFSSLLGIAALIIFWTLPETVQSSSKRKFEFKASSLLYLPAWQSSLLMLLVCISLGSILTIMPDYTTSLGFENKGVFLTVYIAFSLLVRLLSGKISDSLGRPYSTAIGAVFQIISMLFLLFPFLGSSFSFYASAAFYGIGQGFNAPSLFAWASDVATPQNRGKALSTIFIALETGVIIGGLMAGKILTQWKLGYNWVFGMNLITFILSLIFSLIFIAKIRSNQR
jgi:MFS family permease